MHQSLALPLRRLLAWSKPIGGQLAGIMSTVAFMIGAMYFASNSGEGAQDYELVEKAGFADAYPGAGLKFSSDGTLIAATDYALKLFGFLQQDMGMVGLEDIILGSTGVANDNDSMLLSAFNKARDSKEAVSLIITSPDVSPETGEQVFLKLEFVPHTDGSRLRLCYGPLGNFITIA